MVILLSMICMIFYDCIFSVSAPLALRGNKRMGQQRYSNQSQTPPPLLPHPRADSTTQQWSNCDTSPRQKSNWQYGATFLHTLHTGAFWLVMLAAVAARHRTASHMRRFDRFQRNCIISLSMHPKKLKLFV